jgi:hypothetical protein
MEKRITVEKMRDSLNELIEKGMGKRFIGVADYFIGKNYMSDGKNDPDNLWNSVQFEDVHYNDVPITESQQKKMDDDMDKMKIEHPDLFKPLKGITFKK